MTAPTATSLVTLLLRPRDPLIVRDGRPFSAEPGARASTLPWPLPQTLAGALRHHIGDAAGFDWRDGGPARALGIGVHGGFPVAVAADGRRRVYLPAPRDAVLFDAGQDGRSDWRVLCLRPAPLRDGEGMDRLPSYGLQPLTPEGDGKAFEGIAFWSLDDTVRWLATPRSVTRPRHGLTSPRRDARVHVGMDRDRMTAADGALFSTSGLVFSEPDPRDWRPPTRFTLPIDAAGERPPVRLGMVLGLLTRVTDAPAEWQAGDALMTMGGERRVVAAERADDLWPAIPPDLLRELDGAIRLRLQLAAPAIFAGGWRPGWLQEREVDGVPALVGRPPDWDGPTLRLISAAVGRRMPVSGWDLKERRPKAIRYAVPAGSVYFFETLDGSIAQDAADALWLRPIGDRTIDGQDASQNDRDGYGLAVPGIWDRDTNTTAHAVGPRMGSD